MSHTEHGDGKKEKKMVLKKKKVYKAARKEGDFVGFFFLPQVWQFSKVFSRG